MDLHPAGRPETRLEISYPDYRDWRARSRSFQDLAAHQTALGRVVWEGDGEPVPAAGFMVSGHFFDLLGVRPAIGRALEPADDRPGAELVLVLSDALWRRELGGSTDALGRTVRLDGMAHTVVGVMPAEFDYPRGAGFWRAVEPAVDSLVDKREIGFLSVIGRLRPGVTPSAARRRAVAGGGRGGARGAAAGPAHRHHDRAARRAADRPGAAGAAGPLRRDRAGAAHRLRQRGEPAAGPGAGPPPRAGGAHRARRGPRPAAAPAAAESVVLGAVGGGLGVLLAARRGAHARRDGAGRAVPGRGGDDGRRGGGVRGARGARSRRPASGSRPR